MFKYTSYIDTQALHHPSGHTLPRQLSEMVPRDPRHIYAIHILLYSIIFHIILCYIRLYYIAWCCIIWYHIIMQLLLYTSVSLFLSVCRLFNYSP